MQDSNTIHAHNQKLVVTLSDETPLSIQEFITDSGGGRTLKKLTADECVEIAARLNEAAHQLKRQEMIDKRLPYIEIRARWTQIESEWDWRASGSCVYFMRAEDRPRLIKIGQTSHMSTRLTAHRKSHVNPRLIALAKTPDHIEFEKLLHMYFYPFRSKWREWFDEEAVNDYLEGVFYQ